MSYSYKDYFDRKHASLPKPKFEYGDRVSAVYKKIPLIGMVIREQDDEDGKRVVLIHADLPIQIGKEIRHVVFTPLKTVKKLKEF